MHFFGAQVKRKGMYSLTRLNSYSLKIRPVPSVDSCQERGISFERFPRPWQTNMSYMGRNCGYNTRAMGVYVIFLDIAKQLVAFFTTEKLELPPNVDVVSFLSTVPVDSDTVKSFNVLNFLFFTFLHFSFL